MKTGLEIKHLYPKYPKISKILFNILLQANTGENKENQSVYRKKRLLLFFYVDFRFGQSILTNGIDKKIHSIQVLKKYSIQHCYITFYFHWSLFQKILISLKLVYFQRQQTKNSFQLMASRTYSEIAVQIVMKYLNSIFKQTLSSSPLSTKYLNIHNFLQNMNVICKGKRQTNCGKFKRHFHKCF